MRRRSTAGSYSLFTKSPAGRDVTVILNENANQGGTRGSRKELNLLRIQVVPKPIAKRERLAFLVADFGDDGANIDLSGTPCGSRIQVKLATVDLAAASIKGLTDNAWRPYNAAARYLLDAKRTSTTR